MKYADHTELSDLNGQCLLTVLDMELHDFLDDFFTEQDIEVQVVYPPSNPRQYQLLFPSDVPMTTVYRLISKIEPDEINRIFRINNEPSEI